MPDPNSSFGVRDRVVPSVMHVDTIAMPKLPHRMKYKEALMVILLDTQTNNAENGSRSTYPSRVRSKDIQHFYHNLCVDEL